METQKKRRGDRKDGRLMRELDSLHYVTGILYPNRCDNEAYISQRIDLTNMNAYIAKKNETETEFPYTMFHLVLAALMKTITLRPKLNRFYANENYYQRNKVTAGFIIKKEFSDGSEEAVALEQAMKVLGDQERQILILHAVTGLKHREIAEMLGMPLATVLSKYARSLKKLKKALEEDSFPNKEVQ